MSASSKSSSSSSPRRRRRWGWPVFFALLLAGGGAYAYMERPWETKPLKVEAEIVKAGPVTQVLAVNGRVAARETVNIRAAVSGQALERMGEEGSDVKGDHVLLRIDPASAEAVVAQARAPRDAGLVQEPRAKAAAGRAQAHGENATRSTREDADLA